MEQKPLEEMTVEEKRRLIRDAGGDTEHLLSILLELQHRSAHSCIDPDTAGLVAEEVGLSPAQIYDVISFYAMLSPRPRGRYVLEVCNSTPCHYSRSNELAELLMAELGIGMGETTPDGMFSLCFTPCVGRCDIGPVVKVKDEVYGQLTADGVRGLLADLRGRERRGAE